MMTIILWIAVALLFSFIAACGLFLFLLTVAAALFKGKRCGQVLPLKLAVIIPAHNEELQIDKAVNSVLDAEYPKSHRTVIVIADNCTDSTAETARKTGAKVFERFDFENRGKGQALDWFLTEHDGKCSEYDGLVLMDADTEVTAAFLGEIAKTLSCPGVQVVQGFYGVTNYADSLRTALMAAAFNAFNHVRPAGMNVLGGSAGLRGNGMAFRAEVLLNYGWPAHSPVEDAEFGLLLARDGLTVHYNPRAEVYSEMPADGRTAKSQRLRWEGHRFFLIRAYVLSLFSNAVRGRSFGPLLTALTLVVPPLSVLVILTVVAALVAFFLNGKLLWVPFAVILCVAGHVVAAQIMRRAPAKVWWSLFTVPFFIVWKLPIYLQLAARKTESTWVRTRRKSEDENKGDIIAR